MARPEFVEGGFYHVYNRGTDKRNIFLGEQDYVRFIHYFYICNDSEAMEKIETSKIGGPTSDFKERDRLVDILCYVLMPNHFHLLLKQRVDGGISKFVQKFSTGYTMYFNTKNERDGVLFQGKFKSKFIDDDSYLATLIDYIHLNPVDLFQSGWKEDGIEDKKSAKSFLEEYRWSSYPDYVGKKNFPSLLDLHVISDVLGDTSVYGNVLPVSREEEISNLLFD